MWEHLPLGYHEDYIELGSEGRPYRLYRHDGGSAFVFGINHPASPRWSYVKWSPWAEAALAAATAFHRDCNVPVPPSTEISDTYQVAFKVYSQVILVVHDASYTTYANWHSSLD